MRFWVISSPGCNGAFGYHELGYMGCACIVKAESAEQAMSLVPEMLRREFYATEIEEVMLPADAGIIGYWYCES